MENDFGKNLDDSVIFSNLILKIFNYLILFRENHYHHHPRHRHP